MKAETFIASRRLDCVMPGGKRCRVSIGLTKPERDNDSGDWFCRFFVKGGKLRSQKIAFGVDSMQCLLLAKEMLESTIRYYERQGFKFSWLGRSGAALSRLHTLTTRR